jgi:hypothetical protein
MLRSTDTPKNPRHPVFAYTAGAVFFCARTPARAQGRQARRRLSALRIRLRGRSVQGRASRII